MNINEIVDLIINDKFTTRDLWYSTGLRTERVEAQQLVEPAKELKAVMTDMVVYEFLNTSKQVCQFISTVYTAFDDAIKLYNKSKGYSDKDIFFIYKGGNVLRFVSNQAFDLMPGRVKSDLLEYYRDSFKKSDADFSIYINPKHANFDVIFADMTNLAYLVQNYLRNIFLQNPQKYFNFYTIRQENQTDLLNKYLVKLNETEVVKNQTIPGKFTTLSLPNSRTNTGDLKQKKYLPKKDFELVFDKKANILESQDTNDPDKISSTIRVDLHAIHLAESDRDEIIKIAEAQNEIYGDIYQSEFIISVNRTTTFLVPGGLISFNLIRTKISFNATRVTDQDTILNKIDGELIDVSITNRGDYVVDKFFDNAERHIAEYTLQTEDCDLKFRAYSTEYLTGDLENILFVQNAYPWDDPKYAKRLKRLLFMYYLSLFIEPSTFKNNNERIIYVDAFKNMVLLPAQTYNGSNSREILDSIEKFNTSYAKYNEPLMIKNLVARICALLQDPDLDLEKYQQFINQAIENLDVLNKSLVDLNKFIRNSGDFDEDSLYMAQIGGEDYYTKYRKYKAKYMQIKKFCSCGN